MVEMPAVFLPSHAKPCDWLAMYRPPFSRKTYVVDESPTFVAVATQPLGGQAERIANNHEYGPRGSG